MLRRRPRLTRTDTRLPYTALFRSGRGVERRDRFRREPARFVQDGVEQIVVHPGPAEQPGEHEAHIAQRGSIVSHGRSEEHTSELQSLMRISYAVFCLKKNTNFY